MVTPEVHVVSTQISKEGFRWRLRVECALTNWREFAETCPDFSKANNALIKHIQDVVMSTGRFPFDNYTVLGVRDFRVSESMDFHDVYFDYGTQREILPGNSRATVSMEFDIIPGEEKAIELPDDFWLSEPAEPEPMKEKQPELLRDDAPWYERKCE